MWHVFNGIQSAIIVYDHSADVYTLNAHAKALLDIESQNEKVNSDLFHRVTFSNSHTSEVINVKSLFTLNLAVPILLHTHTSATVLNIERTELSDSLSMITLETIEDERQEYDFDRVISEISAALIDIQNDNIDQQIDFALRAIGTVCKADRSYLFEFNTDNETITNTHEWVQEGIIAYKDRLQSVPKADLPYFFDVMNSTHLFQVNDVAHLPLIAQAEKAEFEAQSIKSVLCIGLRFDTELVGFIGCDCVINKRFWNKTDLIRIKLVGEIINNALKNINYKKKLHTTQQQLINANVKLNQLANTDALTNIANRRYFDTTLDKEIKRCAREGKPLSLIITDIDFFKRYNDRYGHQKGDYAIQQVAKALNDLCQRSGDITARYGGEEFVIILPDTNSEQCEQFALLIQKTIKALAILHDDSPLSKYITLSLGSFSCTPNENSNADQFIKNADIALYQAKTMGRNKISSFKQETNHSDSVFL